MSEQTQLQTIIIDGQEYDLSMFSPRVQRLTQIILLWENELTEQRLEVAKTEAALRQANAEITALVKEELGGQSAEQPAEAG